MSKYDDYFDENTFDVERPQALRDYEQTLPEIEVDLCSCDFDESTCPVHSIKKDED